MILNEHVAATMSSAPDFDLEEEIRRHMAFSRTTFGPGTRLNGVLEHMRRELVEIEAKPTDLGEWVDQIILSIDGAWRNTGASPHDIVMAIKAKLAKIKRRSYPDWRTVGEDSPIEHIRGIED